MLDDLMPPTLRTRFDRYVVREPGCWLWIGCKTSGGYGSISVSKGRSIAATWASLWLVGRPLPDRALGELVMHTCDVRACVNPEHLVIGTQRDNLADMKAKGRSPNRFLTALHGAANPASKLTWTEVGQIREERAKGRTLVDLAREFGVSHRTIRLVALREIWTRP